MESLQRTITGGARKVGRLKIWQLTIILLLLALVSATLLRVNNLGMIERREAVLKADEAGNAAQIRESLQELQRYVTAHMNTDLGDGLYLEHSYARARDAALERATNDETNPNSAVYQRASIECRSRFQGGVESYRNDYVQCVIDQVGSMTEAEDPTVDIDLPRADIYRHDFVSPLWSPDAAGLAVLLSLLIAVIILVKIMLAAVTKLLVKKHSRPFNS